MGYLILSKLVYYCNFSVDWKQPVSVESKQGPMYFFLDPIFVESIWILLGRMPTIWCIEIAPAQC